MIYDASPQTDGEMHGQVNEPLLLYNADILEIANQLPETFRQFGWFFRCKYTQWHATACILTQLCHYSHGPAVDRAWAVLDEVFNGWEGNRNEMEAGLSGLPKGHKSNALWEPFLNLLRRAAPGEERVTTSPPGSGYNTIFALPDGRYRWR